MKNILDVISEVTTFIIGEEKVIEDKKQKSFGFTPEVVKKKRKYTKRKKK